MNLLKNFYKGKRVLITGHTGFKGSWLTLWLESLGAKVTGISLPPYTNKGIFALSGLEKRISHHLIDIREKEATINLIVENNPEILFHLAAQPLVIEGYNNPVDTFETNILGTVNILEAARQAESLKQIVIITTDKVYQNKNWIWGYRENDRLGGYDPYSASKAASEIVIDSYVKSFFNPENYEEHGKIVASVRAGNIIGGGDWSAYRIIPDFFRSVEENRPLEIRNPDATRPWQHVLDALGGYLVLAAKMDENPATFSGAWNFGPSAKENLGVKELITKMISLTKQGEYIIPDNPYKLHEANQLQLDTSKVERLLGYESILNINEALKMTAQWYSAYKNNDIQNICLEQIHYWNSKFIQKFEHGVEL